MMKRSWNELANDDEADDLDEQETEDWSASSALILSPSSKETSQPFHGASSKCIPQAHSDKSEHERTIVHVDLDCFYAQVEMIRDPELRTKPLGIQQKNIVVTCNYVAREYGVTKLMYIKNAKEKCPNLVLVSGEDLTHYREYSQKVSDLLQSEFSSLVEKLGFDENFVDVSSLVENRLKAYQGKPKLEVRGHIFGSEDEGTSSQCSCGCHQRLAVGSQIAAEMRERLKEEVGLTGCAGVAWNKLLAKLVGEKNKPNDQTTLFPGKEQQLMIGLGKVRRIPGIGHSMNKKLATLGITTILELQKASSAELEAVFGSHTTTMMKNSSFGIDSSPVNKTGLPQTMSDEDSFKKCATVHEVMETMVNLLEKLSERLQKDGRVPQTIRLTVRKFSSTQKWQRESRQTNIPNYVTSQIRKGGYSISDSLLEVLMGLFNRMVDAHKPFHLTLINICFANFQDKSSPDKSLDTYFMKDKNSPVVKELKSSNTGSYKVSAAALTTEAKKVTAHNMTKEKKFGPFEKYFKRHNNCDKKFETNGQEQRSSFFELKSAKMLSAASACDPNQGMSRPKQDCRLESPTSVKKARVSDMQSTSKGIPETESFETSICKTDGKLVQENGGKIGHSFEKVHSAGHRSTTDSEKEFYSLPGISRERTVPLEESKVDLNHQPDVTVPTESIDHSPESSSSSLEIPPDVDEAIFRSLPPDIREELLIEWRRKKHQSSGSTPAQPSQKYLSKLPHSNKRITDFFGKS